MARCLQAVIQSKTKLQRSPEEHSGQGQASISDHF